MIIFSLHFGMNFFLFFFLFGLSYFIFANYIWFSYTLFLSPSVVHSRSPSYFSHLLTVRFAFKSHNHKHSQLFAVCGIESTSWFYVVSLRLLFCHTLNYLASWVLPVTISLKGLKTKKSIAEGFRIRWLIYCCFQDYFKKHKALPQVKKIRFHHLNKLRLLLFYVFFSFKNV